MTENDLINDGVVNDLINDGVVNDLINDGVVNDLINDKLINDLINDKLINDGVVNDKLINDGVVNDLINDGVVNDKLTNDKLINDKLINDGVVNDLINDGVVNDKLTNDKLTNTDDLTNDGVVNDLINVNNNEVITKFIEDEHTNLKDIIIESKNTISSKEKGVLGEEAVCSLIRKINPKLDVILVSSTGHLADIHVIDYKNNIKYIVEVKYKQIITRDDVVKFEKDVESMKKLDNNKIVGLFLSINSDNIISIGNYYIDFDMIYLTSKFINERTLSMIFDIIALENKLSNAKQNNNENNIKYEIPPNVIHLIAQLRAEYVSINHEKETYLLMKNNMEKNLCFIQELLGKLILKEQFIKLINDEFSNILPVITVDISQKEEDKLRNYISTTNKKKITKKSLLTMFPTLSTQLGSMKLQDIIAKYSE